MSITNDIHGFGDISIDIFQGLLHASSGYQQPANKDMEATRHILSFIVVHTREKLYSRLSIFMTTVSPPYKESLCSQRAEYRRRNI
jgi:hypothetical protein